MTHLDETPTIIKPSYAFWMLFYGIICSSWLLLFVMSATDKAPGLTFIKDFCVSASDASIFQLTGMWSLMIGAMRKVWPWKVVIESELINGKEYVVREENILPVLDASLLMPLVMFFLGMSAVIILEQTARQR